MRPMFKGDFWSWKEGDIGFKKRQYSRKVRHLFKKWIKNLMDREGDNGGKN